MIFVSVLSKIAISQKYLKSIHRLGYTFKLLTFCLVDIIVYFRMLVQFFVSTSIRSLMKYMN